MIKTIIFSLFSCSLLGFSIMEENEAPLLKTTEGIIILTANANISDEDAAAVMNILNQQDGAVGSIKQNIDGETIFYGDYDMGAVEAVESSYNININQTETNGIFGWLALRKNAKCSTHWNNGECDQHYKFYNDAALDAIAYQDYNKIDVILEEYGYVHVE